MEPEHLSILVAAVLAVAFLYTSVGHAGATGYIAVMSLLGLTPDVIKPTALVLNVLAATIAVWQFGRAGHFSWSLFWPFALLAPPLAFLGGYVQLPARAFQAVVGVILLASAYRLVVDVVAGEVARSPNRVVALATGGGIGFLAGLTGTGGGVFLTPLLLFKGWAVTKQAAAVSAAFILINSVAGIAGSVTRTGHFPAVALVLCATVVAGAIAGSYYGSRRFEPKIVKRLLAIVLVVAGVKLIAGE